MMSAIKSGSLQQKKMKKKKKMGRTVEDGRRS